MNKLAKPRVGKSLGAASMINLEALRCFLANRMTSKILSRLWVDDEKDEEESGIGSVRVLEDDISIYSIFSCFSLDETVKYTYYRRSCTVPHLLL